jgi:hypothetical protein
VCCKTQPYAPGDAHNGHDNGGWRNNEIGIDTPATVNEATGAETPEGASTPVQRIVGW